jgi:hypothetical protein
MKKVVIASLLAVVAAASFAQSPAAETPFAEKHPRRAEVNHRLVKQNQRIHHEVKEGDLTRAQAATLHRDDHAIRREEGRMTARNGGYITKQEQHTLNQQENQISAQIGQ